MALFLWFKTLATSITIGLGGAEINMFSPMPLKNVTDHTAEMVPENMNLKNHAEVLPKSRSNSFVGGGR